MSSRRFEVILIPAAQVDFEDIVAYTRSNWGDEQARTYGDAIRQGLQHLAAFLEIGRARDDLRPGRRLYQIRHHVIVYRLDGEQVVVLRILHERMNITGIVARQNDDSPS